MPRKPRIHYPGALYHVILRGNARQAIFTDPEDRCRFSLLLQEGVERFGYRIHAFCLMTNHVHLALQVGEIPLSRIMHNLAFRYTRWVNKRQNRVGHLFQGRYRAVLVDADSYALELVRYIHLNPVRAGMVNDLEAYPWSGHRALVGQEVLPWMASGWVLSLFGNELDKARSAYRRFVADGLGEGHRPEFHSGTPSGQGILGDDRFVERVKGRSEYWKNPRASVADIVAGVCSFYGVAAADLSALGKSRAWSEPRAVAAWLAQEQEGVTLSELSLLLRRDISSLSSAAMRLVKRAQADKHLAEKLKKIKASL